MIIESFSRIRKHKLYMCLRKHSGLFKLAVAHGLRAFGLGFKRALNPEPKAATEPLASTHTGSFLRVALLWAERLDRSAGKSH